MSNDALQTTTQAGASAAPRRRGRRMLKWAVFTLVIWAAFALLLEIAVRLFVPVPVRTYHPWLGTHIRPGVRMRHRSPQAPPEFDQKIAYNREGFRDVEHAPRKAPGTFRIVVLGDSIVEAREVALEQTFCRLLEHRLNEVAPSGTQHFEVINCGTSGAGPLLSYLILRHTPTTQDADLVLMVCFPNDPGDDLRFDAVVERDADGRPYRVPTPPGRLPVPGGVKRWLRSHSRAWSYVGTTLSRAFGRLSGEGAAADVGPGSGRDDFFAARDAPSPQSQRAWNVMADSLDQLDALARRRGARFGLVAVPLGNQIRSRSEWEQGRKVHKLARGEGGAFQEHLDGLVDKGGIALLDLLPTFEAADDSILFFPYDGHLTAQGHRLAAESIQVWLEEAGLLNREPPQAQ